MSATGTPSRRTRRGRAPGRDDRAGGWGTALVAGLGVVAVYLLAVWTPAGQYVDDRLMTGSAAAAGDTRWADALLGDLVRVPFLLLATAVAVSLAGLVHGVGRALAVAAVAGGTVLASQVLKAVLDRPVAARRDRHSTRSPAVTSRRSPAWRRPCPRRARASSAASPSSWPCPSWPSSGWPRSCSSGTGPAT